MKIPQDSPATPAPSHSHRIFAKLASLLSARWFIEILQAIFFIYLARLSTSTYGEFMLAINLGTIIRLIAEFGLNVPLVGLLSQKDSHPREVLTQMLLLKAGLFTLAFLGAIGFMNWQRYASPLYEFALIISMASGLEALTTTFFTTLQVQGRQIQEGKIRALAALLGYGYGFAAIFWGAPPLALAFFKPIETLVNLVGGALSVGVKGQWPWPSLAGLGATLRRVLIFAVLEVTAILFNKANIFFLQGHAGSEGVAQYSATWQIVDGASTLASILLQSIMFPLFVKFWDVDRQEVVLLVRASARWLLGAGLVLMLVLWAESDRIILLIYGPHFGEAIWLQRYLVITIFFSLLHHLAGFLLISMRLERLLLMAYLGALAANLLLCWLFIPPNPLWGAALAIILTKGGLALATFWFMQRRLQIFPLRDMVVLAAASLTSLSLYWVSLLVLRRGFALLVGVLALLGLLQFFWGIRDPLRKAGR
ncbi:MAG: lipopolysaccharide biosynthesis protein [Desulfobaccales bacterium]